MPPPSSSVSLALWNFSSQWFLLPQGTGIIALMLRRLDYKFQGLNILAEIVWIYTIVQLGICLFFYALRVMLYPKHVAQQLRGDIAETSFLSSFCIAFTTIIQMVAVQYGSFSGLAAYVLWWVNAVMAILVVLGIPYVQLKLQPPGTHNVSPIVLLPFIAALTSAAGGGVVCSESNISARLQIPIVIVSYLEIGAGLAAAVSLDGVIFFQHFNRHMPTQNTVYRDMVLCGPFGQGSFALVTLGQVVMQGSFANYNRGEFLNGAAATPIGFASQFAGLLVWGYGTFWWFFAIVSICQTLLAVEGGWRKIRYSMSAWALIFPWVSWLPDLLVSLVRFDHLVDMFLQGVYTNAAIQFGKIMHSPAFRVWSTALLLILLILWFWNQIYTIKGIITGHVLGLDRGWKWKYLPESGTEAGSKEA